MSGFLRAPVQTDAAHLAAVITPSEGVLFDMQVFAPDLTRECSDDPPGFWLLHVAAGKGRLLGPTAALPLAPGDLVYGRLGRRLALTETRGLHVQGAFFRRDGSGARLASLPATLTTLTKSGSTALLAALIAAAAGRLRDLTADDIRSLELSLLELVTTAVSAQSRDSALLPGSVAKNALARRALQTADLLLSNPDLSPALLAQRIGISLRYLQQIFEAMGENANHYIRRQRLARCHRDLADPLYGGQSIAEICYRWGYSDAAYFSRSFREAYGLSPSEHRARARGAGRVARRAA